MTSKPSLHYDEPADILHIEWCRAYAGQRIATSDAGATYRYHPVTGVLEGIELLGLARWSDAEIGRLEVDEELRIVLLKLVAYAREG